MPNEVWTEDLCQLTGCMPAHGIHLPEAILRGHVALGEDEVIHIGGPDVGDTVSITGYCDRSRETGDCDRAIELRESVSHGLPYPIATGKERDDAEQQDYGKRECEEAAQTCEPRIRGSVWKAVAADRAMGELGAGVSFGF